MESRAHYTVVGLFVILLSAAAVLFTLWMGRYGERRIEYKKYYTYMAESISGLPKGGDVKYMGVEVGKVTQIYIDPKNPTYIRLTLQLPADFIVREGMYTTLKLAGITGIAYVEIDGGRPDEPPLKAPKGKIPVIPSRPSALSKLGDTLPEAAVNIDETFKRINKLLDDKTITRIQSTIARLQKASEGLEALVNETNRKNLQTTLKNLAKASGEIDRVYSAADAIKAAALSLSSEGNGTLAAVRRSADAVTKLSDDLKSRIDAGEWDLKGTLQPTLRQTRQLLLQTQSLIELLKEDARMIKESPRDLLFKEAKPLPGPGEK